MTQTLSKHFFPLPKLHTGMSWFQSPVFRQIIEELEPVIFRVNPVLHEKENVLLTGYPLFTSVLLV